jgi:hypothetical protein
MVGMDKISSNVLDGSCECVEETGVGWGVWSKTTVGVDRVKRKKGSTFTVSKGFGKVYGQGPTFMWRVRADKGN